MKHVVYALGTRPEVIRSAAVCRLLEEGGHVRLTVLETGQHYDQRMWNIFTEELDFKFKRVGLGVREADPVRQTAEILAKGGEALRVLAPDAVCVFGDTNSSVGVALAATKLGLPLIHLEAGCRSYDIRMQEESNRRVIDHLSQLLLCLSPTAEANLVTEHVPGQVRRVGDPQLDEYLRTKELSSELTTPVEGRYGVLTLHRAENVDDPRRLAAFLQALTDGDPSLRWVFPVHPRTAKKLEASLPATIARIEPLGYGEMLAALRGAEICVTDSGGLQKDAYWSRTPTVTVRPSTEWVETLRAGRNRLAPEPESLREAVAAVVAASASIDWIEDDAPYGDGHGAVEAATAIEEWLALDPPHLEGGAPA